MEFARRDLQRRIVQPSLWLDPLAGGGGRWQATVGQVASQVVGTAIDAVDVTQVHLWFTSALANTEVVVIVGCVVG